MSGQGRRDRNSIGMRRGGGLDRVWHRAGLVIGHGRRLSRRLLTAALIVVSVLASPLAGPLAGLAPALAVAPDEVLADPKLEARARALSRNLRCLVCQNQSIDDSDAPLARDLRVLVRERLTQGDTDAQAMTFVVDRFGTFVLLRPPVQGNTLILWLAPLGLLLACVLGFRRYMTAQTSRLQQTVPAGLTPEEAQRLKALLADAEPTAEPAARTGTTSVRDPAQ